MTGRARQGPEPPGGARGEAVPRAFPVARTMGRGLDRDAVAELTRLALGEATGPAGTRALFQDVVEPLCDVFDPGAAADYERAFAQVIQLARRDPRLGDLDRELDALGLGDEDALLARAAEGTSLEPLVEPGRLRLLLVPSRVTLGADVAVTRFVLDGALAACPRAEAVLLGPRASAMILRGRPRARHMGVGYGRGGLLAERLGAWTELRQAVRALTAGLGPRDWLLLDPDSRLTQLGLLVPAPAERHRRFPSRTLGSDGGATLGRLARDWTARVLGAAAGSGLELEPGAAAWARAARGHGAPVIAVSFGTGGNARKRVADPFEHGLLAWLCGQGWRVLLARGAAPEEVDATRRLCAGLERRGLAIAHLPPGRGAAEPGRADVVTWEGDADAFAAAIGTADAYLGYDSAGQHIAAALGVPLVSVFVEANGPRHGRRWTPEGPGPVEMVRLAPDPDPGGALARVQAALWALGRTHRPERTPSAAGPWADEAEARRGLA